MPQLIWSLRARADLQDHYDYLLPYNEESALRAVSVIVEAARKLVQTPLKGVLIDKELGMRKWPIPFGKHGFVVHYVPTSNKITIVRIYHGSQNRPS